MIRFTATDSQVNAKQAGMKTYCNCKLCGHQWSISDVESIENCPSCKQLGKKDVVMGHVPDWWEGGAA